MVLHTHIQVDEIHTHTHKKMDISGPYIYFICYPRFQDERGVTSFNKEFIKLDFPFMFGFCEEKG